MRLTRSQVEEMNTIQLDIFKEFISVCSRLQLKYFMVHGSLLGCKIYNSFFPFDDDIDVAMPREDYDALMEKGQAIINSDYFIQSCITEEDFPLPFAKIRSKKTAFVQERLKNLNINNGIYIDVFPIDYYPTRKVERILLRIKEAVYSARISTRLYYKEKPPIWKRISSKISIVLCPSWGEAVRRRARLYAGIKYQKCVIIVGAKLSERGIPVEWFDEPTVELFEKIPVNCPSMTVEYLQRIYGDYKSINPVQKYINSDNTLTVSAILFSTKDSYIDLKNNWTD